MVDVPLEKITNEGVAQAYKSATAIFKKPLDISIYERLRRNGIEMLENGIEIPLDQMKFYACKMNGTVQFWIEIRKHKENYCGKQAEFESALKKYFA